MQEELKPLNDYTFDDDRIVDQTYLFERHQLKRNRCIIFVLTGILLVSLHSK